MSLNWKLPPEADTAEKLGLPWLWSDPTPSLPSDLHPYVKGIVFATMAVGIGHITEANWRTFYARLHMHESVHGGMRFSGEGKRVLYTADDVRKFVGLRTNVSNEADTKWAKRFYEGILSDVRWRTRDAG
jgi:hypothetical protein